MMMEQGYNPNFNQMYEQRISGAQAIQEGFGFQLPQFYHGHIDLEGLTHEELIMLEQQVPPPFPDGMMYNQDFMGGAQPTYLHPIDEEEEEMTQYKETSLSSETSK